MTDRCDLVSQGPCPVVVEMRLVQVTLLDRCLDEVGEGIPRCLGRNQGGQLREWLYDRRKFLNL